MIQLAFILYATIATIALHIFSLLTSYQAQTRISNLCFNNVSSHQLTLPQQEVLSYGVKFIPTPKQRTDKEYKADFNWFSRSLRLRDYFGNSDSPQSINLKFRSPSIWFPPAEDMTCELAKELDYLDVSFANYLHSSPRNQHGQHNLTRVQRRATQELRAVTQCESP